MKKRFYELAALFLASLILLSPLYACASPEEPAPPAATPAFPLEIIDQLGRVVKFDKVPEKIISLAPSNTEIAFALGLEDRLVGVTEYCDYPEAAKDKPQIGGYKTVDIERVVEIQPDLILATNYHKAEVIPELERFGLTVFTLDPRNLDEVLEAISLAGECAGRKTEATQLVSEMENRIAAITTKTSNLSASERLRTLYLVAHDPLWVAGSETLIHQLIEIAGGTNVAQDMTGFSAIGLELVVMANPQVIIAGSSMGSHGSSLDFLQNDERLEGIDARKNNQLYEIFTDIISRPGPRIVDGLEQLAKMIHPEIFGSIE